MGAPPKTVHIGSWLPPAEHKAYSIKLIQHGLTSAEYLRQCARALIDLEWVVDFDQLAATLAVAQAEMGDDE